jgi:GntR family transcriptional repressor for pyruvate dehydrogenase complex
MINARRLTARKPGPSGGRVDARSPAPLRLARTMALDIIKSEARVGTHLGSLPEVAQYFGISVASLRKALTYLLDDGIVEIREGRGGGLVVAAPPADSAMRAMSLYLADRSITHAHVAEARALIDGAIIERAVRLANEADYARMCAATRGDECEDAHGAVAAVEDAVLAAARQPILALFSRLAGTFAHNLAPLLPGELKNQRAIRTDTVAAILAGDLGAALASWTRRGAIGDIPGSAQQPSSRLAEEVAGAIRCFIRTHALSPGDELGREADLQQRFGSSQPTLRNALRILERSGTVRVSQGRSGGVFVGAAEPYAAIEMTSLYLSATRLDFAAQVEARRVVEARAAGLAAQRITPLLEKELAAAMEADALAARVAADDWSDKGARVERLIAQACANPLVEFFTLVLIDLSMINTDNLDRAIPASDFVRLVSMHHAVIVDDILARCPVEAAFHTRIYLNDLNRWLAVRSRADTRRDPLASCHRSL